MTHPFPTRRSSDLPKYNDRHPAESARYPEISQAAFLLGISIPNPHDDCGRPQSDRSTAAIGLKVAQRPRSACGRGCVESLFGGVLWRADLGSGATFRFFALSDLKEPAGSAQAAYGRDFDRKWCKVGLRDRKSTRLNPSH